MKWNIVIVVLVLSIGLCGQSFGGGLLNKMLGCGCASSGDCAAAPSCGCEAAPSCGCEPSCGCAAEPSCGCEPSCGAGGGLFGCCANPCCLPLKLSLPCLKGCGGCDCAEAPSCDSEPSCGCAAAPSCLPKCPKKCCLRCSQGGGLLQGLMALCAKHSCCGCASSCGCDDGTAPTDDDGGDEEASDAAPMPPAPIVDPSAFVPGKRHVVPTSAIR